MPRNDPHRAHIHACCRHAGLPQRCTREWGDCQRAGFSACADRVDSPQAGRDRSRKGDPGDRGGASRGRGGVGAFTRHPLPAVQLAASRVLAPRHREPAPLQFTLLGGFSVTRGSWRADDAAWGTTRRRKSRAAAAVAPRPRPRRGRDHRSVLAGPPRRQRPPQSSRRDLPRPPRRAGRTVLPAIGVIAMLLLGLAFPRPASATFPGSTGKMV